MNNKKILVIILLVLLMGLYFAYKSYVLNSYNVEKLDIKTYKEFLEGYKNKKTITIDHLELSEDKYLTFKNVKVKNIYSNYTKTDYSNNLYPSVTYKLLDTSGNIKDLLSIGITDTYLTWFNSNEKTFYTSINEDNSDTPLKANVADYLKENKVTTDLDLFSFLKQTKNYKPNIFTSTNKIKCHYSTQLIASITLPKINSFTVIEGIYQGYIFDIGSIKEISIIKKDKRYTFTLYNKTAEEVQDFLNTVVIE